MILAAKGAIATGNPFEYRWLVGCDSGEMYTSTSTTASSWSQIATSSFGATGIQGIASNRLNKWVAVGESGKLATSPDGITWTQRTSSFSTTAIYAVAHANGYWVAVGASGKLATSTDGETWTQQTSNATTSLYGAAYGFGYWVAGGGDSISGTANQTISTGSDPTTGWTSRTTTLGTNTWHTAAFQVASLFHQGHDAGTSGALQTSPTGVTWTARASTTSLISGFPTCAADNGTVAVMIGGTSASAIQSSTNGTTWTARTAAYSYLTTTGRCIAVDDSNVFAHVSENTANDDIYIQTSSDGTTWTGRGTVSTTTTAAPRCIAHSAGPKTHR